MTIVTKFDMGQAVTIKAIQWVAKVVDIKLSGLNLLYGVEYWRDMKPENAWVTEDEIE